MFTIGQTSIKFKLTLPYFGLCFTNVTQISAEMQHIITEDVYVNK